MNKRTIEISLKSLNVEENGEIRNEEGNNVLTVSLLHSESQEQPAVRELRLQDRNTINFDADNNPVTENPYSEFERLLFKTEVNHYVWLNVLLTDVIRPKAFDRFLLKVMGGIFKTSLGALTGFITNPLLKIPKDSTNEHIVKALTENHDKVVLIGHTCMKLDVNDLPGPGGSMEMILDLGVPEDVYRVELKADTANNRWIKEPKRILAKGTRNGQLRLNLKVL